MAEIIVGQNAINRPSAVGVSANTCLMSAPADGTGKIATFQLYLNATGSGNVYVGLFFNVSGNTWECRSRAILTGPAVGYNEWGSLALDVALGDLLGIYYNTGVIDMTTSGLYYFYYVSGNQVSVGTQASFTRWDGLGLNDYSIKGIGSTPAGKVQGFIIG